MEILHSEVEKRRAQNPDSLVHCTTDDIRKAAEEKLRLVAEGALKEVEEEGKLLGHRLYVRQR